MKFIISSFCIMLVVFQSYGQQTDSLLRKVYFDFDKYELTAESNITLNQILNNEQTIQKIFIEANTDFRGSVEYNKVLGANRANVVKDYFTNNSIDQNLIEILNYGENKPLFENETEDGMAKNRRVDILVLYQSEEVVFEPADYSNAHLYDFLQKNHGDVINLYDNIRPEPQRFTITNRDTILVTQSGIIIEIPDTAFDCACADEKITLEVREGITLKDMLLQNFISMDEMGEALQTGGMLDIDATTESGQALELNKEIIVNIPTDNPVDSMSYFEGKNTKITSYDAKTGKKIEREEIRWEIFESRPINIRPMTFFPTEEIPCCDANCIVTEYERKVESMKKYNPKSYETYQKSIEKAQKEIIIKCRKEIQMQIAIQRSFMQQNNRQLTRDDSTRLQLQETRTYYSLAMPNLQPTNVDIYLRREFRLKNMVNIATSVPMNKAVDVYYISQRDNFLIKENKAFKKWFSVPKGKKLTIIGVGIAQGGQMMLAMLNIKAKENKTYDLEFQPVEKDELLNALNLLNR